MCGETPLTIFRTAEGSVRDSPPSMGCTVSYSYTVDQTIVGRNQDCTDLLISLSLEQADLNILFTAFTDIDADDSGTIRYDELFAYFHIEPTKFNETVFGYCDIDHRGYLTFLDFVIGIWLFLTVDQHELGGYAFILFDMDCTGSLDSEEIINLIHIIHNKTTIQSQATLVVLEQLKQSKEVFTCEKFQYWTRTHLSLLEPIQTLQLNLRKNLIGNSYWDAKTEYRKMHPEYTHLSYVYNLRQSAYKIQKRQVIGLIEERIMLRRKNELNGAMNKKLPRGQRTTALLEYFNLSKGESKAATTGKLGLTNKGGGNILNFKKPVKRKDLEQRYRVGDDEFTENNETKQNKSADGAPFQHSYPHRVDKIPEGHESKDFESRKYPAENDLEENKNNLDIKGLQSSSKDLGDVSFHVMSPSTSMGVDDDVKLTDVLICPDKQRRRRSSFLMKKPRLLLKSEKAMEEIKQKNKKKGPLNAPKKVVPIADAP